MGAASRSLPRFSATSVPHWRSGRSSSSSPSSGQISSDWAQTAMFGALLLMLFAAGATILDHEEPALRRLSSVLWSVGVVAMVGAFYIVFDPILGMSVAATWMTIGAISSVVAGVMLWRQEMPAQHIVLFGAIADHDDVGDEPAHRARALCIWSCCLGRRADLDPRQQGGRPPPAAPPSCSARSPCSSALS